MRKLLPFLIAIVLGAAAVVVGREVLQKRMPAAGPQRQLTKVVVAKQDLEPGSQIQASLLSTAEIPLESLPSGAVRQADAVKDRVVAIPVARGQTIVESALAPADAGVGLEALVPPGMRAVTIEVNEYSGMTGLLIPGCHVDVITTLIDDRSHQTVARTILENVKVTAMGRSMATRPDEKGLASQGAAKTTSATLLVTPEQAEALDLAASKSRIRLVLRSARDKNPVSTAGVTVAELVGRGIVRAEINLDRDESRLNGILKAIEARLAAQPTTRPSEKPEPAPAVAVRKPPLLRSVQLIRGGAESTKTFEVVDGNGTAVDKAN